MFLDSEPEVIYPAIESNAFGLPLMARKRTATLLYSTEEVLTVLEFFAVGDLSTAVLLRAVKGGVNLPQTNISAIFKVHLSLFLIATFKASYRTTNGFDNYEGANFDLALWVAYYNFLRPHKHNHYQVLNKADMLNGADNMPGKWQLLIFLGQQTILNLQTESSNCS